MDTVVKAWAYLSTFLDMGHFFISLWSQARPFPDQRDPAGKIPQLAGVHPVCELSIWTRWGALGKEIVFLSCFLITVLNMPSCFLSLPSPLHQTGLGCGWISWEVLPLASQAVSVLLCASWWGASHPRLPRLW